MKLPQLSLRELFLLVALVAMGCGWWVDRSRLATALEEWEYRMISWPTQPGSWLKVYVDGGGSERYNSGYWGSDPKQWEKEKERYGFDY